jgi:hypothetical protein
MAFTIDTEMKKKRYTPSEARKRGFDEKTIERLWGKRKKGNKK